MIKTSQMSNCEVMLCKKKKKEVDGQLGLVLAFCKFMNLACGFGGQ